MSNGLDPDQDRRPVGQNFKKGYELFREGQVYVTRDLWLILCRSVGRIYMTIGVETVTLDPVHWVRTVIETFFLSTHNICFG